MIQLAQQQGPYRHLPKGPVEIGKTQEIRLGDVFILGPFMIWCAAQTEPLPGWARSTLFFSGIGTIVFNLYNYETQQRLLERGKS